MVVHDVDVRPVGVRDGGELALEVGEVGRQDRRGDLHARHPSEPGQPALPQQREEHRVGAVHVRPELHVRPLAQTVERPADGVGEQRAGVDDLDVVPALEHVAHDEAGLGDVGAAGGVGDDATGRDGIQRGGEQRALQRRQLGDVGRLAAPAGLGPAAQRTEPGAGGVDEHPRVGRGLVLADHPPVGGADLDPAAQAFACRVRARSVERTRSARCGLTSIAVRSAPASTARAPSTPALPPGPAHRSSQRAGTSAGTSAAASASATSWDPSSCTAARPSRTSGIRPGSPEPSTTPIGEMRLGSTSS